MLSQLVAWFSKIIEIHVVDVSGTKFFNWILSFFSLDLTDRCMLVLNGQIWLRPAPLRTTSDQAWQYSVLIWKLRHESSHPGFRHGFDHDAVLCDGRWASECSAFDSRWWRWRRDEQSWRAGQLNPGSSGSVKVKGGGGRGGKRSWSSSWGKLVPLALLKTLLWLPVFAIFVWIVSFYFWT